jgi:hypothetical protein
MNWAKCTARLETEHPLQHCTHEPFLPYITCILGRSGLTFSAEAAEKHAKALKPLDFRAFLQQIKLFIKQPR